MNCGTMLSMLPAEWNSLVYLEESRSRKKFFKNLSINQYHFEECGAISVKFYPVFCGHFALYLSITDLAHPW